MSKKTPKIVDSNASPECITIYFTDTPMSLVKRNISRLYCANGLLSISYSVPCLTEHYPLHRIHRFTEGDELNE